MTKEKMYFYIGTNGSILTPIHILKADYFLKWRLSSDEGKVLTKDNINFYKAVTVPEDEVNDWKEVKEGQK